MFDFVEKQLEKRPVLVVSVIAILAVAVASATGVLGQLAAPIAKGWTALKTKLGSLSAAAKFWLIFALPLAGLALAWILSGHLPSHVSLAGLIVAPALWGFRKVDSLPWPVRGSLSAANPVAVQFDLKRFLADEIVSALYVRVAGNITKVGAAPGAATGRENPEALVTAINARSTPSLGVISKGALGARGIVKQGLFDRGYSIQETDVSDAAETIAIDFRLPLLFKTPGAQLPIEFGLPLSLFKSYVLEVLCGGRDQLYTGGTPPTWNLDAVNIELWVDYDRGVAGKFHLTEEFEQIVDVVATKGDLKVELAEGYVYTSLLFLAERDNVLVNDIINCISVESAGRSWLPFGGANAAMLQRWDREMFITNPAEVQTGVYYVAALRDGMVSRALDMKALKPDVKLDVTLGGGTTRRVTVHGRRLVPQALTVQ
jgi:hypothetical protein